MPNLDRADAAHLLRRTGFDASAAAVDDLVGVARADAVDRVLDLSAAPTVERPPGLDTASSLYGQWMVALHWWIDRMVTTPVPLQERMTLFWHSHFATQSAKVGEVASIFDQTTKLRAFALGGFAALCDAVAKDGAMLVYLDNGSNTNVAPQENFARELMELFTLGEGNYVESDVAAMARAWTGHNHVGWTEGGWDGSHRFWPDRHDGGMKTLFGLTQAWDGPDAIREIVLGSKQQACATFVASKLARAFVRADPSPALLTAISEELRRSRMEIGAAMRALLLHPEFWDSSSRNAIVKSPVEFVVELLRRFDIRTPEDWGVQWGMPAMGQVLFDPPGARGWSGGADWLTASAMSGRMRWSAHVGGLVASSGRWSGIEALSGTDGTQRILNDLGIEDASVATRARIESWFEHSKRSDPSSLAQHALVLGAMSPEFQVR